MNPHTWFRRIAPALRRNRNTNVGRAQLATPRDNLRAALAEFISTFIFVFAVSASATAVSKLTVDAPTALITAAVVRAFAFFAAVSAAVNISGGHVNPAVTFGALLGGNITLLRAALYFLAQLLGSIIACLLLKFTSGLQVFRLSGGVRVGNAVVLEMVMTFGLVHTVYATSVDPKRGNMGPIAPIAIGFIIGANVLVGGAFDGASMNPALSLGPALLNWSWSNHWVYWVGPLIGGGLAGYVYELVFINKIKQPRNDYDYDYYGYYYS